MKPLTSYAGAPLQWRQPTILKREYELNLGTETLATLRWPGFFSQTAQAEGFGGHWEFVEPSIWKRTIEIRRRGDSLPFATFEANFWGRKGTIALPKGRRLAYTANFWANVHSLNDDFGRVILILKNRMLKIGAADVEIGPDARALEEHPWVVMLVWAICLSTQRRSGAA